MGGACITHGIDEKNAYKISFGEREGKNHSEDLVVDGRMLL
jgi:hypothetical protein